MLDQYERCGACQPPSVPYILFLWLLIVAILVAVGMPLLAWLLTHTEKGKAVMNRSGQVEPGNDVRASL